MSRVAAKPIGKSHITTTPGVCGGKPCIAGSRIRVQDIFIWHERQGQSPDEIVARFPQLSLADVYAALAYLWDHRAAVVREVAKEKQLVREAKKKHRSKLLSKIKSVKTDGDSISS